MALVKNISTHPLDLTDGRIVDPGATINADLSLSHEQDLQASGRLVVVNASTDPAAPASRVVGVRARVPYAGGDPFTLDLHAATAGQVIGVDGTPVSVSAGGTVLPWVTGTVYKTGQPVTNGGKTWLAVDNHTAGATFAGDQPLHWSLLPTPSFDPTDVGYDIVVVAGQSNASGRGQEFDAVRYDPPNDRIYQFGSVGAYANVISVAVEPLAHLDSTTQSVYQGPGLLFSRWLLETLSPNRRILIVPCGYGNTGFSGGGPNTWDPAYGAGSLYERTIAQVNAAYAAAGPNTRVAAFVWHQGEYDSGMTANAYAAKLDALIDGFRTRCLGASSTTPFLVGRLDGTSLSGGGYSAIDSAHVDTPNRKTYTATAAAVGRAGVLDYGDAHFRSAGQRVLARNYFDAYLVAQTRTTLTPSPPGAPTGLTTAPGDTKMDLTWSPSFTGGSAITDYVVQYRLYGATTWTTFADGVGTTASATVTGLTNGTAYEFRVAAVNALGTGPFCGAMPGTPSLIVDAISPLNPLNWYAADSLALADGTAVSSWTDKSGATRHATQATGANQPLFKTAIVNGKPVLRFDGINDYLSLPNTVAAQPITVVAVLNSVSDAGQRAWLGANNVIFYKNGSNPPAVFAGASLTGTGSISGAFHIASCVLNGSSSAVYLDNANVASGNGGASVPASAITIGINGPGGGFVWSGDIAELVVFGAALTAGQLVGVHQQLAAKYAIAIS